MRPTVEVRCESCLAVVSTRHAWDAATCACGRLTVSGRPWRPTVAWLAAPGGGWTETTHEDPDGRAVDDDEQGEPTAPRPIGYRPTSPTSTPS
jgi:hypothetical protein